MRPPTPPRLARRLLHRLVAPRRLEAIEGDLEEQFRHQLRLHGRFVAHLTFWRDVLLVAAYPRLRKQRPGHPSARGPIMLTNYLLVSLRTLRKQFGYAIINVVGLAIGLACCTLILLFVQHELSYDTFHTNADRVFRVDAESHLSDPPSHITYSAYLLAEALESDIPEIEQTTRMSPLGHRLFRRGTTSDYESDLLAVEPAFLVLFDFPLLQGDPKTALEAPFSIILTEALAEKYFGAQNPLGQTLQMELRGEIRDVMVTGVMDAPPANSHLQFTALLSFASEVSTANRPQLTTWTNLFNTTYLLLRPGADWKAVEAKLPALLEQHVAEAHPNRDKPLWYVHYLQPLPDIHLNTLGLPIASDGDVRYVYVFSTIALLILLIACINYMNLATSRSTQRAKEVGVRKVLGAQRSQLAGQFLTEALLLSVSSFLLALVLVEGLLPLFIMLTGKSLATHIWNSPWLFGSLLGASLLAGFIAGSYPALVLSGFRPMAVLRGRTVANRSGAGLRKGLVVGQFAASAVLIIATLVVFRQLDYIQTKRLGFDEEQVVTVPLRGPDLVERGATLKSQIAALPGVQAASLAMSVPGGDTDGHGVKPAGAEEYSGLQVLAIDTDYKEVMNLMMASGRWYDATLPTDSNAFVINEATAAYFGWNDPIGQEIDRNGQIGPVIGVVENFHFKSLHKKIEPLILYMGTNWWEKRMLVMKLAAQNTSGTLAALEGVWTQIVPDKPFAYDFLDDELRHLYTTEIRLGRIFGTFAFLGIFVACLGLFGLAAFTAEQRTKEIGIRKVLGASVTHIVTLLTRDFIKLVVVAFIVAAPVAYLAMDRWLDDFAYRIEISWPIFLIAGLTALAIAWLTVSYQSIKAALTNPVTTLRYE